jgi:hypothetical protein
VAPSGSEECSEEIERMPPGEFDALVLRRVAERERQLADRAALRREHVERRSQEVICWPGGRICPVGRLGAWVGIATPGGEEWSSTPMGLVAAR